MGRFIGVFVLHMYPILSRFNCSDHGLLISSLRGNAICLLIRHLVLNDLIAVLSVRIYAAFDAFLGQGTRLNQISGRELNRIGVHISQFNILSYHLTL